MTGQEMGMKPFDEVTDRTEEEMFGARGTPLFPPKEGSVFPAKRKSVKKMMFHKILKSITSLFSFRRCSSKAAGAVKPNKG